MQKGKYFFPHSSRREVYSQYDAASVELQCCGARVNYAWDQIEGFEPQELLCNILAPLLHACVIPAKSKVSWTLLFPGWKLYARAGEISGNQRKQVEGRDLGSSLEICIVRCQQASNQMHQQAYTCTGACCLANARCEYTIHPSIRQATCASAARLQYPGGWNQHILSEAFRGKARRVSKNKSFLLSVHNQIPQGTHLHWRL